jgi:hypothetical protein
MHIEPDGKINPTSPTFLALLSVASHGIRTLTRLPPVRTGQQPLTDKDYASAARELGCTLEAIKAVSMAESKGSPFLHSGKVKILFEPHHFGRDTQHVYDLTFPELSKIRQIRRSAGESYGGVEEQYEKLQRAMLLDRTAALRSASWGRFQVLGSNWQASGATSLDAFIEGMFKSEKAQLDLFVAFVKRQHLDHALKRTDWAAFAKGYNGSDFHRDNYDGKIAEIYRHLLAHRTVSKP